MGKIYREKEMVEKLQNKTLPDLYFTTLEPTTTTFRPWDKNSGESRLLYIQRRAIKI
jgi:hypothetical protein